jgi:agmatinase
MCYAAGMSDFDPNAAAHGDGIYGLPHTPAEARVVLIPVPWDATTSYRAGTAGGPAAILAASRQVDLWDIETGKPYEAGIAMLPEPAELVAWNREARALAEPIIAAGGTEGGPELERVNALGAQVNDWVRARTEELLAAGKLPGVVGGDHSVPFGAIAAAAARYPGLGVLHLDAHADLRQAYEGFTWSHASIMYNVATRLPDVSRLVQVGIRDLCEAEAKLIEGSSGRIRTAYDSMLANLRFAGEPWAKITQRIIKDLPREVWLSFDIDGLDPSQCPHTGTPVPGGLSFAEASYLIGALVRSERRIVGFDLNEVAPGPDGDEWDANVGARMLYKMIGWALKAR